MKTTKNTDTIGIDLGDNSHETCTLNKDGAITATTTLLNCRPELEAFSIENKGATIILEAGTHSPWISRLFEELGHKVIVANPRKLSAIYKSDNKTDERDAEMLARMGRFDPKLLHAIQHSSLKHQRDRKVIDTREALVDARTNLINYVRSSLKSFGIFLPKGTSTASFAKKAREHLAEENYALFASVIETVADLTERIKAADKAIDALIEHSYPEALKLQQVDGVGPITSLTFVLTIGSPDRFEKARDVGPFLGLVPKRDQSGESDKALRITKAGDKQLRRLLVSCAQYALSDKGPDCALKRSGLKRAKSGGKTDKKKAVVKTARKIAVLLLAIWKDERGKYLRFPHQADDEAAEEKAA